MGPGKAMERFGYLVMTWLAALLLASPAYAQNNIAASLVPETRVVAPGQTVTLALVMKPNQGWHGYWKNPGDSGIETSIAWQLPQGVTAGPIQYPVPDTLIIAGLMNYVYKGDYTQLIDVSIPAGLAPGTRLPLRGRLDYLACTDEICVPESAEVAVELETGTPGARNPAFDDYRQALPKPLGTDGAFQLAGNRFRIAVPIPASLATSEAYFFPLTDGALAYAAPQAVSRSGDTLIVETDAGSQTGTLKAIEGVLKIGDHQGLAFRAMPGTVPATGVALAPAAETAQASGTVLAALIGALIGGLLLNIMPCVFPILSLKAISLARAGGDERSARREALAYTAGAVAICLALGAALLAIRSGGAAAGWAFQLQDSRVILFLLLLVTAIALNLSGLFELPSLGGRVAQAQGAQGAFWTGALAAFIATPCTGPFMGAALGAALVLPTAAALAVFAGLGLGLAAALVVGLALWWLGHRQSRGGSWLPLAPAALAALAAVLLVPTATEPAVAASAGPLKAEPFSEPRLSALRAENRPVFVYFTADWCVTCKVNEKGALERQEVAEAFAARNVAVLVGDWTRGDAGIGRFLEKHGRSGVPLYLYYPPGREPQVLPQVLTPGRLTQMVS